MSKHEVLRGRRAVHPNRANLKRLFRWSLRWFLLVTTLVGAAAGLYGKRVVDRRRVLSSVTAMAPHSSRPLVEYDYQFDERGMPKPNAQSSVPKTLVDALGPAFFHDIVGINLDGERIAISDLAALGSLRNLKRLDVEWNQLSSESLQTISELRGLERLDLQETGITDDGLRCVEPLTNLSILLLSGEHITDRGLAHLRNANSLRTLSVRFSSINGSGLAHLSCHSTLCNLDLACSPIEDAAIDIVLRFTNLETLDLQRAKVSDDQLSRLAALKRLSTLRLSKNVKIETIVALMSALPDCKIEPR